MRVLLSCVLTSAAAFSTDDVDSWVAAAWPLETSAQVVSLLGLEQYDPAMDDPAMSRPPPPPSPVTRQCAMALAQLAGPPPRGSPPTPEDYSLMATKICNNVPQECTGVSPMGFSDADVVACACSFATDDELLDTLYMVAPRTREHVQEVSQEVQKMVNQVAYCHLKHGADEECATLQAPGWKALKQCKKDGDSVEISGSLMVEKPFAAKLALGAETCLPKTCHKILGQSVQLAKTSMKQRPALPGPPREARFLAEAANHGVDLPTLRALEDFDPTMLLLTNASQAPGTPPQLSECQQKLAAAASPYMQKCLPAPAEGGEINPESLHMCMMKSGLPDKLCTVTCPEPEGGLLKCACALYHEKKPMLEKVMKSETAVQHEMMALQMQVMSQVDACLISSDNKACKTAQKGAHKALNSCAASGHICTASVQLTANAPGKYMAARGSAQLSMCLPQVCHAPIQSVMSVALQKAKGQQMRMDPFAQMMAETAEKFPVHCGVDPAKITVGKKALQVPEWGAAKIKTSSSVVILAAVAEAAGSAVAAGAAGFAAIMISGAAVVMWRRKANGVRV